MYLLMILLKPRYILFSLWETAHFLIWRKYPGTSNKQFLELSSVLKIPCEKVKEDCELSFQNPCVRKPYQNSVCSLGEKGKERTCWMKWKQEHRFILWDFWNLFWNSEICLLFKIKKKKIPLISVESRNNGHLLPAAALLQWHLLRATPLQKSYLLCLSGRSSWDLRVVQFNFLFLCD